MKSNFLSQEFSFSVSGCSEVAVKVVDSCTCTITVLTDITFIKGGIQFLFSINFSESGYSFYELVILLWSVINLGNHREIGNF